MRTHTHTHVHTPCVYTQNSYLWKIEASPPIYLFGTMHVPYTKLWQHIPDNTKVAFSSSEDLCVELRLSDSNTVSELAQCQRLPKDTSIDELLSTEVRTRIKKYLERIRHLLPNWLEVSGVSSLFGGGGQAYRYVHVHVYTACTCTCRLRGAYLTQLIRN